MSNQPFQVPKPNITPGQVNRPGPGLRLPGPLAGARPGVPKPGFPGHGIKPQVPMNMGGNQQIPPNVIQEEHKNPVENITPEPIKTQQIESRPEPTKTEIPRGKGVPPFGQKPTIPGPGFKPGPSVEPPIQNIKQPVYEEEPQRKVTKQEIMAKEPQVEHQSDQLLRLSESLQAMKNLRNNFQGFNADTEGNEQGYEQNPDEYEGGEDDDYVRVEGTEGEFNNEDQYEENQDELEGDENERYEEQEKGEYYEEEDYRQEDQDYYKQDTQHEPREEPQQTYTEDTREVYEEKLFHSHQVKSPQLPHLTHPQTQNQGIVPHEVSSAKIGKKDEQTPLYTQTKQIKETQESHSSFEKLGVRSESEHRADQNLLLRIEKLELELEKERKKAAIMEREQDNTVQENIILKQKNAELTARIEILTRKGPAESYQSQEIEMLKNELNHNIDETKKISDNANRMLHEANQYREETESMVNELVEEKNNLHNQILQLRREIDEEYIQKIEAFRQKTELFEMKINEYESTFQLVQNQLREKSETLQKITSLNNEIQTALSNIPKTSGQIPSIRTHVHSHPHQQTPKPETRVHQPQKEINLPRSQVSFPPREEQKQETNSRKQSSTLSVPENKPETKFSPARTTVQNTPNKGIEGQITHGTAEKERPPSHTSIPQNETSSFPPQGERTTHPPTSQSETISGEGFNAPPNYRIPNKTKKEDIPKKPVGGFKPLSGATFFTPENAGEKETSTEIVGHHEPKSLGNKPITHPIQKSKLPKMGAASLFEEKNEAENFFNYSTTSQPSPKTQQKQRYPEEDQYEKHEEAEEIREGQDVFPEQSHSINPRSSGGAQSSGKQSKSNLRYSQNPVAIEREPNMISVEAAENFFDQLGHTQNQTQQQTHTISHTQNQPQTQSHIQKTEKPVQQNPINRGRNPFAEEGNEETNPTTDFFASNQPESFVNRPEAQRFNQARINAGPLQTGMPKKVDMPTKGSALKKTKGNIPSSMFE